MILRSALLLVLSCLATPLYAQDAKPTDPAKPAEAVTYKEHIAPILRKHCANCHNPDKATSDLNVTTYQTLMAGGSSGEAVTAGNPDQSLLYRLVAHLEEPHMPPKQPKIPEAELASIKKWIELGAPETAAGAAKAAGRKLDLDVAAVTTGQPEGPPPMPQGKLPSVSLPRTSRAHPVTALAASPWAPLLAVAGHERILLYNTATLELLGMLPFPERIPHVLKFSRNGKLLLAAGGHGASSGRTVLFDVATGERVTEIGDEVDIVLAADVSASHKFTALGGPSKLVKIYSTETGELKHRLKKHTDWITALAFSPSGDLLATGDRNGGAFVWDVESGEQVFTLGDHKDAITSVSWRADSQMLATSSEDGRVILWFMEDGFPARSINAHTDGNAGRQPGPRNKLPGVLSVEFARNGLFGSVGRDNTARIWRGDGNQQARFEGFTDLPLRIAFSHDSERVFVGDLTGKIRVWSMKDKELVGELTTNPE